MMQIQVNTDRTIEGSDALVRLVETEVGAALDRHAKRLTRVEVHLGDEDGERSGSGVDKRCLIEVRPAGLQPLVVTAFSDTSEHACRDAARKMQSLLESTFGRIGGRHGDATIRQNESD